MSQHPFPFCGTLQKRGTSCSTFHYPHTNLSHLHCEADGHSISRSTAYGLVLCRNLQKVCLLEDAQKKSQRQALRAFRSCAFFASCNGPKCRKRRFMRNMVKPLCFQRPKELTNIMRESPFGSLFTQMATIRRCIFNIFNHLGSFKPPKTVQCRSVPL